MADQAQRKSARATSSERPPKNAVVVIHGMGNQSPMETLRSFVEAVWTNAPWQARSNEPRTWSKRDFVTQSFETKRITTNYDIGGKRTDFYEFYWAHMMQGTRFSQVLSWLRRLFMRGTDRVPPAVKAPWIAAWIVGVLVVVVLIVAEVVRRSWAPESPGFFYIVLLALISLAWSILRRRVLTEVVGDAARYLTPSPPNIAARSNIRTAGLDLLKTLTKRDDYDRIIVVCHSLGTVVGYDILSLLWGDINSKIKHSVTPKSDALEVIEAASAELRARPDDEDALMAYREAQRAYFDDVHQVAKDVWKITDFVTLGSPLTHAHFLLVDDGQRLMRSEEEELDSPRLQRWWQQLDSVTLAVAEMFRARAAQRELPLCPPLPEHTDSFTYDPKTGRGEVPHHAALFAPVRWTNIYAVPRNILWGDVVSGPVAPLFGPGVKDVALAGDVAKSFIAHTKYWATGFGDQEHLEALRAAINLLDRPEAEAWERHTKEVARLTETAAPAPSDGSS